MACCILAMYLRQYAQSPTHPITPSFGRGVPSRWWFRVASMCFGSRMKSAVSTPIWCRVLSEGRRMRMREVTEGGAGGGSEGGGGWLGPPSS